MTSLPLSGIRVLDFAQVYAGPTAARLLSDLGADVIKIEGVKRMDIVRNFVMPHNDTTDDYWNKAGYFLLRNGGKRSLTLDFSEEAGGAGIEIVRKLIPSCDIVIESFTPHVMAKLGLDYDSLTRLRPDIIMLSMSGYGQTGPWRDYAGYGMGLEPASGMSSITGYRNGPDGQGPDGQGDPLRTGISFTDPYSGVVGAGAVLAALVARRRAGKGQYIDLSEQEAAVPIVGYALLDKLVNGRDPKRIGNRSHWYAPQGCYRCADGSDGQGDNWLVITVRNDEEWAALARVAGHPEWAEDKRFADVLSRFEHHDEIDVLITSWTQTQDQYAAMRALQDGGVIAAAVLNPKQVLLDEHLQDREYFDRVQTANGPRPVPHQLGAKFSAFEMNSARPAPKLGEHNREILQGELGLSDEKLAALRETGVIGEEPVLAIPLQVMRMFVQWPLTSYLGMGALKAIEEDFEKQLGIAEE